jgi:type VI secretion system protein VasD
MGNELPSRWKRIPGPHEQGAPAWLALLAACLLASGSAFAGKVEIKGQIVAAAELNPDYQGRPSPVNLIVFQLASADAFQNADFFSLYDPQSGVLGGDLIDRSQMLLQPGEMRPFEAELDEEARYIGVIAAFRDIESAQWRSLVELPQKGFFKKVFSRDKFSIELDALAVTVKVE